MSSETPQPAALGEHAELVDRKRWLGIVVDRFGIPFEAFDDYHVIRRNNRNLHLVHKDHAPPKRPEPQIIGMSFMRTRMRYPKITTAAAMTFGPLATRNVVAASDDQADAFLSRAPFEMSADQAKQCTDTGYVLVGREEVIFGVGFYIAEGERAGQVNSMFPKAWTLADQESAFEA